MLALIGLCGLFLAPAQAPDEEQAAPNILIVLVDDLGWGDLGEGLPGIPGESHHRTPHIQAFAKESLSFARAYSAAPNCAPSRASLQTGRYTPRHGVLTVGSAERGKAQNRRLVPPPTRRRIRDEEVTLGEIAKGAGYSTAHLGKWHLGDDPTAQGYDVNVGGSIAGHPKSYFSPYQNDALPDGPEGEYLTTRLTNEAISLLDELQPPFLMHLAYYSVHTPLEAPAERVKERRDAGAEHPTYAAMVEALDNEFGRLMGALESRGMGSQTLVIFTSDNGGYGPVTNLEPLRGYKGTMDEGGIRVPFFVRWPEHIAPGVTAEPIHHIDLAPSLSALAGAEPGTADGIDLAPFWLAPPEAREPLPRRFLGWHFPVYLQGKSDRFEHWRTTPVSGCLVEGRWKLLMYYGEGVEGAPRMELYDTVSDPKESKDLAGTDRARAASLAAELNRWIAGVGGETPIQKQ